MVATPFTLAGAMTPATLAGALAQQHAEALFTVALAQLVRPGTPMVYGGFTSNVDMRTGSPAFGTPEYVKAQLATGQLARRVGLPWRTSNVTASPVVDAQAAYESGMSVWGALTGGASLLYQGAGRLEGGLTASFKKEDGARTATERANRIWKRLLAEYQPPPLDPGRSDAIDAFVERRKREIAGG